MQFRVAETIHTNELLKSKVGRHTALDIVVLELDQERIGKAAVQSENESLKVAVTSHAQAAIQFQEEVNRRQGCMLELMSIRHQDVRLHEITLGCLELVDGWPVRAGYHLPRSQFGEEKHIQIQVTVVFNLFNLFVAGLKRRTLRPDHDCVLICAEARRLWS